MTNLDPSGWISIENIDLSEIKNVCINIYGKTLDTLETTSTVRKLINNLWFLKYYLQGLEQNTKIPTHTILQQYTNSHICRW